MNEIAHNAGLETLGEAGTDTQHLQTTYRLTCHQTESGIVLGLSRVGDNHPARVKWTLPVQFGYYCALVQVSNDGTLEWVGTPDGVVDPKPRPQSCHLLASM